MPYEFLAKNGLISQGNITATGSLAVTQNISASATGSFGIVGIGTNSPLAALDVRSQAMIGDASIGGVAYQTLSVGGHTRIHGTYRLQFGSANGGYASIGITGTTTGTLTFNTWDGSADRERLRIVNTNGYIGVGTTNPSTLLQLNGDAASHQIFSINRSGSATPAVYIGNDSNSNALIASNNTVLRFGKDFTGTFNEYARIDTNGNVGIGTTTVSRKLHTYTDTGPVMRLQSSGSNASIEFIPSSGHNRYNWLIGAQQNISDAFEITPSTATNGTTFSNPSILVKSDGNVGIGTTAPTARLHVSGSHVSGNGMSRFEGAEFSIISLKAPGTGDGTNGYWGFRAQDTSNNDLMFYGYRYTSTFSGFWVDPSFSQNITKGFFVRNSDGSVGIGTNSPSAKLHVNSSGSLAAGSVVFRVEGTSGSLFSVDDTLSGSLMSVNDITGLPILEVFSDDRVVMGTFNSNTLVVTGSRVGVGTSSPAFLLDVSGSSRHGSSASDVHQFTGSINLNGSLSTNANITASNISASRTGSFGAVGIGTSNVDAKLTILGTSTQGTAYNAINLNNSDRGGASIGFKNFTDASVITLASVNVISEDAGSGNYNDGVFTINTAEDTTNLERFRITSRGHVGIGTTSPDIFGRSYNRILGISGSSVGIQLNSNTGTYLDLGINGTRIGGLFASSIAYEVGTPGNFPMHFYTSGSYKMSVLVNGNVGIGTTTPNSKLEVAGNASSPPIISVYHTTQGRSGSLGIDTNGVYIQNSNNGDYFDLKNATGVSRFRVIYDNSTHLNTSFVSIGNLSATGSKLSVFGNLSVGSTYGSTAAPSNGAIFQGGVGIGTTNPYYAFDVYTNSTAGALMSIRASGSANARIYFDAANGDLTGGDYCYIGQESGSLNFVINTDVNSGNIHIQPRFGSATDGRLIVSGSSQFGRSSTSNHQFTGSVNINGGLTLTNLTASNISASGTSSFGYVGIGTTSPSAKLTIVDNTNGGTINLVGRTSDDTAVINFRANGDASTYAYVAPDTNEFRLYHNDGFMSFYPGGSEKVRITSTGNVGIGISNPSTKLHITGSASEEMLRIESQATGESYPQVYIEGNKSGAAPALATQIQLVANIDFRGRGITFSNRNDSARWFAGVPYEGASYQIGYDSSNGRPHYKISSSLYIQDTGNVGIGTYNPQFLLDVVSTTTTPRLRIGNAGSNNGAQLILAGSNTTKNWVIANQQNFSGTLEFTQTTATGSSTVSTTPSMVINSSGNVGIGTSSPAEILHLSSSGATDLRIEGAADSVVQFVGPDTQSYALGLDFSDSNKFKISYNPSRTPPSLGTNDRLVIDINGNVGVNTATPGAKLEVYGGSLSSPSGSTVTIANFASILSNASYLKIVEKRFATGGDWTTATTRIQKTVDVTDQAYIDFNPSGSAYGIAFGTGATNPTQKMVIDINGNVGIGTTSPTAQLHICLDTVTFPAKNVARIVNLGYSGITGAQNWTLRGAFQYSGGIAVNADGGDLDLIKSLDRNTILATKTDGTQLGNVGIGTTAPAFLLDVSGSSRHGFTSTNTHQFTGSVSLSGSLLTNANITASNINASGTGSFGIVGIGTSSPFTKLNVVKAGINEGAISFEDESCNAHLLLQGSDARVRLQLGTYNNGSFGGWIQASYDNSPNSSSNSGTEPLILNPQGGSVGIGTVNPGNKLEVASSAFNRATFKSIGNFQTGIQILRSGSFDTDWELYAPPSSTDLRLYNSSDLVTFKSNGNVGIGLSTPNNKLHVYNSGGSSTTASNAIAVFEQNSNAGIQVCVPDASEAGLFFSRNGAPYYSAITRNGTDLLLKNGSATAVTINSSRNVGIGTASPAFLLDVSGSSRHGYQSSDTHQFTGSVSISPTLNVGGVTYNDSIDIDKFDYFTLQPYIEAGNFPSNVLSLSNGTAPTFTTLTGSDCPFGKVAYNTTVYEGIGDYIPVNPGETLYGEIWALRNIGSSGIDGTFHIGVARYDKNKNPIATNLGLTYFVANGVTIPTSSVWTMYSGTTTLPTTHTPFGGSDGGPVRYVRPYVIVNYNTGTIPTYWGAFKIRKQQLTRDAGNITISGSLGIGTSTASSKLTVVQTTGSDSVLLELQSNNDPGIRFGRSTYGSLIRHVSAATDYIAFNCNGSSQPAVSANAQVVFNENGNVGIGTISPTSLLELSSSTATNPLNVKGVGSWGTSILVISSSGKIGFGTNSPSYAVHVQNYSTAQSGMMYINAALNSSGKGLVIDTTTRTSSENSVLALEVINTSGTNTLAATVGGNVGIGITNPAAKLAVTGSGTGQMLVGDAGFGSGNYTGISVNGTLSTTAYNILSSPTDTNLYINRPSGNDIRFRENNQDQIVLLAGGNVGVGTSTPSAKVQISGSANSVLLNVKSPVSGNIVYVTGSGAVGINTATPAYTLQVNGSFAATTKSFVIDHPTKPDKKLVYGSLESPYHGIRLTGRDTLIDGKCVVELPDYISKLVLPETVNIQLTGIKCNKVLYVDEINIKENNFTVAYDKGVFESYKDYDFFWDFTAIRADVPQLKTEI